MRWAQAQVRRHGPDFELARNHRPLDKAAYQPEAAAADVDQVGDQRLARLRVIGDVGLVFALGGVGHDNGRPRRAVLTDVSHLNLPVRY